MVNDVLHDLGVVFVQLLLKQLLTVAELSFYQLVSAVGNHRNTNEVDKGKPVMICKHSVPETDHVVH